MGALPSIVASGASLLTSVFGGASQAQKDAARVKRGNDLYACALNGDPTAARIILYGANNTKSDSPVGVQHYQALLAQLRTSYPTIYNAAVAAGAVPDTGSGTGCPSGIPATPGTVSTTPATAVVQSSLAGSSDTTLLLIAGAAALGFALLGNSGKSRRRRS